MTNKTKNKLERELAEATDEVNRHTSSSVRYELLDGIRQLAQVALTQTGNVETLEAKLAEKEAALARLMLEAQKFHDDVHEYESTGSCEHRNGLKSDCEFKRFLESLPEQSRDGK